MSGSGRWRWWLVAGLALLLSGCRYFGATPLHEAADQAAALPFVVRVDYRPEDFIDDEGLDVYIADDAEPEEIRTLWCDILAPGGADFTNTVVMYPSSHGVLTPACS